MTVKPSRWFIAVILTLSLAVTAIYFRYYYYGLAPPLRLLVR